MEPCCQTLQHKQVQPIPGMIMETGATHNTAIKQTETFYVMGRNMKDQLGDGVNPTYQFTPEQIGTNSVSIAITVKSFACCK